MQQEAERGQQMFWGWLGELLLLYDATTTTTTTRDQEW